MKALRVSAGIIPLSEFKARAARFIKGLDERAAPLVITQNGRPAAVVLAPEAYDRLQERERYLEAVAAGLADATAGRVVDHERVVRWLETWGRDDEGDPAL